MPTSIEFVDIAGLVKGASTGEGLGNKFLANIRECDSIVQVSQEAQNTIHDNSISVIYFMVIEVMHALETAHSCPGFLHGKQLKGILSSVLLPLHGSAMCLLSMLKTCLHLALNTKVDKRQVKLPCNTCWSPWR